MGTKSNKQKTRKRKSRKNTKMRKYYEKMPRIDLDFEELVKIIVQAEDDLEIERLVENGEKEEEIDIYKKEVHPIHLLDDLKALYDRHGVIWRQNKRGNVYARGETCNQKPYVFYVNWEKCSTVQYYIESEKRFFKPFGEWTWDRVPIDEMLSFQDRAGIPRKRKNSENEEKNTNDKESSG